MRSAEAWAAFAEAADHAPLERQLLSDLLERARAEYAPLDVVGFAARLGSLAARGVGVDRIHAADLALAWSAARGEHAAVRLLERTRFDALERAIRRQGDGALCDEVRQLVRMRAFGAGPGPSILWDYDGRGELRAWLRVVGVRAALDLRRQTRREVSIDDHEAPPLRVAGADPELAHLRARHAVDFREAFTAALAALEPKDRVALRLYFVDRLTIDQLGELWRVHRVTAARRVTKVRTRVLEATKEHLKMRLALGSRDLASLLADLDVSLAGALEESD